LQSSFDLSSNITEAKETKAIKIVSPVPRGMPQLYIAYGMPTIPPPMFAEIKANEAWKIFSLSALTLSISRLSFNSNFSFSDHFSD
jgi:hypothetical protein